MKIQKYELGELRANCYFLVEDKELLIIDPADDAAFILEQIQRQSLKPLAMLATHGHFDHVMAAGEIQSSFDMPMYLRKEDGFLVKRMSETARHFLGYDPVFLSPKTVTDLPSSHLEINNFKLEIILSPGHTPGGASYYFPELEAVFTGDTLFKDGIGRYDLSYSSKLDLFATLERLMKLPEETVVYPGHGEATTIMAEKTYFSKK